VSLEGAAVSKQLGGLKIKKKNKTNLICFFLLSLRKKQIKKQKFFFLFCEVVNYAKNLIFSK